MSSRCYVLRTRVAQLSGTRLNIHTTGIWGSDVGCYELDMEMMHVFLNAFQAWSQKPVEINRKK